MGHLISINFRLFYGKIKGARIEYVPGYLRTQLSLFNLANQRSQTSRTQQSLEPYVSSATTPSKAALQHAFDRQAYVEAIISLLTRRRAAFSMVEWDELRDLALACNPAVEDCLITSRRTAMRYASVNYHFYAERLADSL